MIRNWIRNRYVVLLTVALVSCGSPPVGNQGDNVSGILMLVEPTETTSP